jgi:hypothetical protein
MRLKEVALRKTLSVAQRVGAAEPLRSSVPDKRLITKDSNKTPIRLQ